MRAVLANSSGALKIVVMADILGREAGCASDNLGSERRQKSAAAIMFTKKRARKAIRQHHADRGAIIDDAGFERCRIGDGGERQLRVYTFLEKAQKKSGRGDRSPHAPLWEVLCRQLRCWRAG